MLQPLCLSHIGKSSSYSVSKCTCSRYPVSILSASCAALLLLLPTSLLVVPTCCSRGGRLLSPNHTDPCAEVHLQTNPEPESAPNGNRMPHHQKVISQIRRGPLSSSPPGISMQSLLLSWNGIHASNENSFNMLRGQNPLPSAAPGMNHN
ncbi:hypothetical protein KP509_19G023300 [Ceratopteris richardii]|uniref:Uncharacterized protein n=1 Tax=Ceratopteris richardii TaxID=49495 RepID=A0A8T2SLS3_CERRI|nr:hypothetical protein KP509_19G023300 [Ceratopteris richardii]